MSASQAVSLTCSVAPGRRRVRGWGRRVPVRRACVLRARCGAACGFSSVLVFPAHARARRVFPMLFNPRANPVTASYGNGPRRDHAANVRPRKLTRSRAERPRPVRVRACNSIYIYLASNTAAPPSFKTRAPHLTQTCIRAHTRCEASLAIGTKGAIERRGSVASILTILDGIKGSQPNHMRASPCF